MTRIFIAIEQHFVEYQGNIYTDIAFSYSYWKEYLQIFDEVCPIGRVRKVTTLPKGWQRADGPNVCFISIVDYVGFWDLLTKMPRVLLGCWRATRGHGAWLLRAGTIATFCWFFLRLRGKPYSMEMVGHAGESVLAVRNVQYFGLQRLIALIGHALCRAEAKNATCVSYVSEYVRRLYPNSDRSKAWTFSSVRVDEGVIGSPRTAKEFEVEHFHIISVGRLEPEKGHRFLIEAVRRLSDQGHSIHATVVGPGKEVDNLRQSVEERGLSGRISICGAIPWGSELFAKLDEASLFVLPSLTEGMPRSLIEAMARGLPAIGSDVGGIKELLPEEYRVPPRDVKALAGKIVEVIDDFEQLAKMSQTNFAKAKEYRLEIMNQRKMEFWQSIKRNCC
jgi:glycosyltransferase involved in cell wall biosynthesis